MRIPYLFTVITLHTLALGQQPNQPRTPPPDQTFAGAAQVSELIAKAKAQRKPDQANFIQPLLTLSPYSANLEYRVEGIDTPATLHEKEAELIYVVEGAATFTMGGKLVGERRTNPSNLSGTGVEGGTPRHISAGDFIFVPENTPHAFTGTQGHLVIMSLHVPRVAPAP